MFPKQVYNRFVDKVRKLLYEEEWRREIQRRVAEIDSGAVKTIPWSEVREHLYSVLRETEKASSTGAQSARSLRSLEALRRKPEHGS